MPLDKVRYVGLIKTRPLLAEFTVAEPDRMGVFLPGLHREDKIRSGSFCSQLRAKAALAGTINVEVSSTTLKNGA